MVYTGVWCQRNADVRPFLGWEEGVSARVYLSFFFFGSVRGSIFCCASHSLHGLTSVIGAPIHIPDIILSSPTHRWASYLCPPYRLKGRVGAERISLLKRRYVEKSKASPSSVPVVVAAFGRAMTALVADLPTSAVFPFLGVWHLVVLEPTIAQVPLAPFVKMLTLTCGFVSSSPRATLLTLLRLVTNALGIPFS